MRIIAIPFAAGTATSFTSLQKRLSRSVKMTVFEYPGHGQKIAQSLLKSIPAIAQELIKELFPLEEPYCLLGYSMGGHVLCEVYRLLLLKGYKLPDHVFLCAIDIPRQKPEPQADLSDATLQKELEELDGTPLEVLRNQEFMELLLPIYRADILAERSYVLPLEKLFQCKGTVIIGTEEMKEEEHYSAWQKFFFEPVNFYSIHGGHFFIQDEQLAFAEIINSTMKELEREIRYGKE